MQFCNKQILVAFSLALVSLGSTCFAQQDNKVLLNECLKAHADEIQPLVKERDALYQKHSSYVLSVRSILRWLEQDPKTADSKRLKEIANLESRLQALKDKASLTSAESIKDTAATIESTNVMLEDIQDEHDLKVKPLTRQFTALQRKFSAAETKLKPVMQELFRKQGDSESTADLVKSYGSFSYTSGTASGTYKREGDNKSAAICYIYLINQKTAQKKYGMFDEKYPIAYRSKNTLEVLIGDVRVTIYSSDPKFADSKLDKTLISLVDLEALEAMLTP